MSTVAFATAAELASRLGVVFNTAEVTRADGLLTLASRLVERAAGRDIGLVENDVLIRRGIDGDVLRLKGPVVSVASVTSGYLGASAVTIPASDYVVDGDTLVHDDYWPDFENLLTITYTHGYSVVPITAKLVVLEAVVRVWINPGNVASEGHGGESVSYAQDQPGLLLTVKEEALIKSEFGASGGTGVRTVQLS